MKLLADLRSDTVTRPSEAMRRAMIEAPVGDDVYREDPSVRKLEERVAEIVGKAAALFVPSGTMANQIALLCHTRPGDEVICGEGTHCVFYESGASSAWSGVQFESIGQGGLFGVDDVAAAIKPRAYYCPNTSLVVIENTHNRGGGRVFPQSDVEAIAAYAREQGLGMHLDGARVWNAAAASKREVAELCQPFDTVSVCFSKGLGAPVGSAICGDTELIERAVRFRKMLGGGMRQAGILAAGALYALDNNRERLSEDHAAAQQLAEALRAEDGIEVPPAYTNIVNVALPIEAERVVEAAAKRGVLFSAMAPQKVRLVTHLDAGTDRFDDVIEAVVGAHREALRSPSG
jgi:threonine aldolase